MMNKKCIKRIVWVLLVVAILAICAILSANHAVEKGTNPHIYSDVTAIPHHTAALLLGTSKTLRSGKANLYFQYRIDAAVALFKSGKIDCIVISGDNGRESYNEPEDMKVELVKQGIPEKQIYLDHAGFRTLDSVVRMNKVFGQNNFTVISQEFHNRRAIYIAQAKGLNAIGFNAKNVDAYSGFKTQVREKLARVKLFLDLWTDKSPKFLGEPIKISQK